jgi:hypothetical protein
MAQLKPYDVVLRYLETDAALMAVVLGADGLPMLFAGGLPSVYVEGVKPPRCINLYVDPGQSEFQLKLGRPIFVVECFGNTQDEAWTVYNAFAARNDRQLNNIVAVADGTAYLYQFSMVSGPQDLPEPELGWPRVVARWQAIYWEVNVT